MMGEEKKIAVEEVDSVDVPPRARVTGDFERKRDYLAGFLSGEKPDEPAGGPGSDLQASVVDALKSIYDPEIPVDIYELGLIYKVDVSDEKDVAIDMTLTAPGCPVAGDMPGWVQEAVEVIPEVNSCTVNLVFDPPWDQSMMSDEAKLQLNMF